MEYVKYDRRNIVSASGGIVSAVLVAQSFRKLPRRVSGAKSMKSKHAAVTQTTATDLQNLDLDSSCTRVLNVSIFFCRKKLTHAMN